MPKFSFTINAEAHRFETWLGIFTQREYPMVIWLDSEAGKYLQIDGGYLLTKADSQRRVGVLHASPVDLNSQKTRPSIDLISFEIFEPAQNKTSIALIYRDVAKPLLVKMLQEIASYWPEAEPPITRHLNQIGIIKPEPVQVTEKPPMGFVPPKNRKGQPFNATVDKINRLIAYRNKEIRANRPIPGKIAACGLIPIDPKTIDKLLRRAVRLAVGNLAGPSGELSSQG